MKLRTKILIIIILISLTIICCYQIYLLIDFYDEQYRKMETTINNVMHIAGYKEISFKLSNPRMAIDMQPDTLLADNYLPV